MGCAKVRYLRYSVLLVFVLFGCRDDPPTLVPCDVADPDCPSRTVCRITQGDAAFCLFECSEGQCPVGFECRQYGEGNGCVPTGTASLPTEIYAIQTDHEDDDDPALGSQVFLRSVVVSAYDDFPEPEQKRVSDGQGGYTCLESVGFTGGIVVQEQAGGPLSGVTLFNPAVVPSFESLGPGDIVDVRGEYLEFCLAGSDFHADSYCATRNTNRLTQLGDVTATKVGQTAAPEAIAIGAATLLRAVDAEPYEGVLVRVDHRLEISPCEPFSGGDPNCCVGDYDRYGNLHTSSFSLTNEYYSIPQGTTCFTSVTGIVSWFGHETDFGNYTISPRGPGDVEIPPDCRP